MIIKNNSETVLFRVCHTGLDENSELGKLLKSGVITKTGFGAGKDANKICKDFGFEVCIFIIYWRKKKKKRL